MSSSIEKTLALKIIQMAYWIVLDKPFIITMGNVPNLSE